MKKYTNTNLNIQITHILGNVFAFRITFILSFLVLFLFSFNKIFAQKKIEPNQNKTNSPYFWVKSKDKNIDALPLKETSAKVNIAGTIADVVVTQVYENTGKETLEAVYIFPASTRAAVYAMKMKVGEKTLIAKIEERQKARETYENAKQEGKTASLLEQQNPNVFQMNVANILPKDKIVVELRYTELLIPQQTVYEFVYPTVVAPRYTETLASEATPDEKWVANPYTKEGKDPLYTFNFTAQINAGMPLQNVSLTTHENNIKFVGKETAFAQITEKNGGNRDVVLRYKLSGGKIQSGLLFYETEQAVASRDNKMGESNESEKFFMLMMQPPAKPTLDEIPPREYVFIVDVSGSMHGFPLGVSKKLLRELISNLRPTDKFNVMLFESSNQMLSPESMLANNENIEKAIKVIDQQQGGGGTRLLPAMQNALNFKETKDYSRTFVVVTDGFITVEREVFDIIRQKLNQANLFAFGIGSSVNRYLIEGMANVGMGEPFIVLNESEATKVGKRFLEYVQTPVLTRINVQYEGFDAYDIEPQTVGDIFLERPIIIQGKYKGKPKGKIIITGRSGNKDYKQEINVSQFANYQKEGNQALPYLWARTKIRLLDDYNKLAVGYSYSANTDQMQNMINNNPENAERIKTVTTLGLKYNLLTAYTSFVAVDEEVRNKDGKNTKVQQVLPLPKGVSNNAIGTENYRTAGVTTQNYDKRVKRVERNKSIQVKELQNAPKITKQESAGEIIGTTEIKNKITDVDENITEELEVAKMLQDAPATYTLGELAWENFVMTNKKYPQLAVNAGKEGTITLTFTIEADGSISHIKVKSSKLGFGLEEEAIRILKLSSKQWTPATKKGKATKSIKEVQIKFELTK